MVTEQDVSCSPTQPADRLAMSTAIPDTQAHSLCHCKVERISVMLSVSAIELTKCVQMASHWVLQRDLASSGLLSMDPSIPSVYARMKSYWQFSYDQPNHRLRQKYNEITTRYCMSGTRRKPGCRHLLGMF